MATQETIATGTEEEPLDRKDDKADSWPWFCCEMIKPVAGPDTPETGLTGDCSDAISADGWLVELRWTWIESCPPEGNKKKG